MDWQAENLLLDLNTGKTQLVLFDRLRNFDAFDVKMGGSDLDKKLSFKMPGLPFSCKLDWSSCCSHPCPGGPNCILDMLDKLQNWVYLELLVIHLLLL